MLSQLAQARAEGGRFRPADIAQLIEALRVPPGNVSRSLSQLTEQRLAVRGKDGWALTALGEQRASDAMGDINAAALEPEIRALPGTNMGNAVHSTLPPTIAPLRWQDGIGQLLAEFPFDRNVFLMTRFPRETEPNDPLHRVISGAREVFQQHRLTLHLASDRVIDEDLLGNIAAHMWACQYGVGIFEDRSGRGLNYNVLLEIGSMTMAGRRCALLKDTTAPDMPTDLVGRIYKPVNVGRPTSVANVIHSWIADDLKLGRCAACSPG